MEIIKAVNNQTGKSKKEEQELEEEQNNRLTNNIKKQDAQEQAKIIAANSYKPDLSCNATTTVCVLWEKSDGELLARGRAIAYRNNENEHYAEVKTQGYNSNTLITIVHNDHGLAFFSASAASGGM